MLFRSLSLLTKVMKDFPISYHERHLSLIWNKTWEEEKKLPIKTITYSPGGFGLLGGKYSLSNPPDDERKTIKALSSTLFPCLLEKINELKDKYGTSQYSIALSWVIAMEPWAIIRGAGKEKDFDIDIVSMEIDEINQLTRLATEITSAFNQDNVFSHNWLLQ